MAVDYRTRLTGPIAFYTETNPRPSRHLIKISNRPDCLVRGLVCVSNIWKNHRKYLTKYKKSSAPPWEQFQGGHVDEKLPQSPKKKTVGYHTPNTKGFIKINHRSQTGFYTKSQVSKKLPTHRVITPKKWSTMPCWKKQRRNVEFDGGFYEDKW